VDNTPAPRSLFVESTSARRHFAGERACVMKAKSRIVLAPSAISD
jgi:hypothetical protein